MFIGPQLVTDGLVLALDAANNKSYPGSGTTWSDLSGNGYTGTLENGVIWEPENGGYWNLSSSNIPENAHLSMPYDSYWDDNVFGNATNFTISCWTQCDKDDFYDWSTIIQKSGTGASYSNSEGASLWARSSSFGNGEEGVFQAVFGNGQPGNPTYSSSIITYYVPDSTQWYNLTFTGEGSAGTGTLTFYVNGIKEGSDSIPTRTVVETDTNPIAFGRRGSSLDYLGKISNIQLYTRALSSAEVLQNYNALKSRFI